VASLTKQGECDFPEAFADCVKDSQSRSASYPCWETPREETGDDPQKVESSARTKHGFDGYRDAMVDAGALPPVADRLPAEPIIFKTGAMVDGIGEYGGVFRHVIGGRPEGWNWMAGQHQGWGGINMAMQECRRQHRTNDQSNAGRQMVRW